MSSRTLLKRLGVGKFLLDYWFTPVQRLAALRLPARDIEVNSKNGRLLVFSPRNNPIGRALYDTGVWEPEVTDTIESATRPGMIALDVGADIGYYSLQMSKLVGSEGQVVAFEPIPKARKRLLHNLAINGCTNVTVSEFALGNREGVVYLEDPFSKSRLNLSKTEGGEGDIKVSLKRFDDLVKDLNLPSVDIIKMDIEGAEHEALRGMEESLRRFRPVLVVEVHNHYLPLFSSSAEALLKWLADLGYEVSFIESNSTSANEVTSSIYCQYAEANSPTFEAHQTTGPRTECASF